MEKIIIIGAVAAGTSAAAKARRNDENVAITIYEKDDFISYSGCGMPYFLGGEIESIDALTPRDPKFFKKKYNIDVQTGFEVIAIDQTKQVVTVKNLSTNEVFEDHYDKLVLATGASPAKPNIQGLESEHVFFLRSIRDVLNIKNYLTNHKAQHAVIAGTGFIGFEVLENLRHLGIEVTVVEIANKITPNLDEDMAKHFEGLVAKKGVTIKKGCHIVEIAKGEVKLSDGTTVPSDMVVLSTGVRPNTQLAESIGVELGETKAIKVNTKMQTNVENIYACGDCIETFSSITGKPVYRPLGSTANKTGRIAGDVLSGGNLEYKGNLGTGIFKFFDIVVASTGLNEKEAQENGFEIEVCHNIKPDKPAYMNGKEMVIKGIADKQSGRLLGVQIVGYEGVDKRIDVFATLITYKAHVEELFHLDLAYAPPFSTTKDPVHYTGMILDNAINQDTPIITAKELATLNEKVQIIDARSESDFLNKGSVEGAVNIPQAKLRSDDLGLDKDVLTVTYCNKGVTGNAAQNILKGRGFKNVKNLSGGHKFYKSTK